MNTEYSPNQKRLIPLYIVCYVLWFGFVALSMWTVLQWHNALYVFLPIVGPWVFIAIDKFGVLLFGLVAVAWLIYVENYLRVGVGKGLFWRRVGRIALVHLIVLGAAYALMLLDIVI